MPSPPIILAGLSEIAQRFRFLAIGWHAVLGAFAAAVVLGWRPSWRALAGFSAMLLASVAALAWIADNFFNGAVFFAASVAALAIAFTLDLRRVTWVDGWRPWAGTGAIAFGWVYPHFVDARIPLSYLYAAPTGLLPCPTLSLVIGLSFLAEGFGSRAWSVALSIVGLLYAAIGVFRLGVTIDAVLGLAALALLLGSSSTPVAASSQRDLPASAGSR